MDGEGNFNWRFVFPFSYLPYEKKLVLAEKVRLLSAVMFLRPNKFWNKTGTRQYTQAVWSTFAGIHSAQPGALIRYLGYWNFRLEFVMPHISQQTWDLANLSYDCDLWKHLVFLLHLALFRLVGLSKRKIIEPSLTAFIGFPFALVFTFTEYII